MSKKHCYSYRGPVYQFEKMIVPEWIGQTFAVSEAQARSNFEYRFKCQAGLLPTAKVKLPGKVVLIF